jgi:N6-adenosine-specific RNA methylase IME4
MRSSVSDNFVSPLGPTGPAGIRIAPVLRPAADGRTREILPPDHVFAGLARNYYPCVLIDPPTRFVAGTKGRPQHYDRMTDADIAALPISDLLHPEGAWIFLWVTSPKLYAPPGSRTQLSPNDVARAWGARFSGRAFVWVKTKASVTASTIHRVNDLHVGMGFTTRKNAEDCLLFRTGMPTRLARDVREVIISSIREHSRKPDEAVARIEQFCPGPRVELFARETRDGWDAWGEEVGLFSSAHGVFPDQTAESLRLSQHADGIHFGAKR